MTVRTFVEAWGRRDELDTTTEPGGWISGIALGLVSDQLRSSAPTTGGTSLRNLRIVVDDDAVQRIRAELIDTDPSTLPSPPDAVWRAIERRALGSPTPDPATAASEPGGKSVEAGRSRAAAGRELLRVTRIRRRHRMAWLVAAITAVLVAAGTVVVTTQRRSGEHVEATAQLRAINGVEVGLASGEVTLRRAGSHRSLRIRMEVPPALPKGATYQLALIDHRGARRPVGTVPATVGDVDTTIPLPDTLDTAAFRTVELSIRDDAATEDDALTPIMRGTLRT